MESQSVKEITDAKIEIEVKILESIVWSDFSKFYTKKEITHKINKIETKLSKLNDKREKLLERYKSLG